MRKVVLITVVLLLAVAVVPVALADDEGNGTTVTRFTDIPWTYWQCVPLDDHFGSIPVHFEEDVCTFYEGTWSQTVTVNNRTHDVGWSTSQSGTATFYAYPESGDPDDCRPIWPDNFPSCDLEELGVGVIRMDEVARDLDGDANCLVPDDFPWPPIRGAAMTESDSCWESWGTEEEHVAKLDFLEYRWRVRYQGETIFSYRIAIHGIDEDGDARWCISSRDAYVDASTNCPPGLIEEIEEE